MIVNVLNKTCFDIWQCWCASADKGSSSVSSLNCIESALKSSCDDFFVCIFVIELRAAKPPYSILGDYTLFSYRFIFLSLVLFSTPVSCRQTFIFELGSSARSSGTAETCSLLYLKHFQITVYSVIYAILGSGMFFNRLWMLRYP